MSEVFSSAGQPGALSCCEGQQAVGSREEARALLLGFAGSLMIEVGLARQAVARLEAACECSDLVNSVHECANVAHDLGTFLINAVAAGYQSHAHDFTLFEDSSAWLLSPELSKALHTLRRRTQ